jgi:hypothetical protein
MRAVILSTFIFRWTGASLFNHQYRVPGLGAQRQNLIAQDDSDLRLRILQAYSFIY